MPCITLSHLTVVTRLCVDSNIRILAKHVALVSMVGVFSVLRFPGCPVFWTVFTLSIPHPSITLRVISSQVLSPCGHTFHAMVHMLCLIGCSHSISIWFIVSSSAHVWHWLHSLKSLASICQFSVHRVVFCRKFPVFSIIWIVTSDFPIWLRLSLGPWSGVECLPGFFLGLAPLFSVVPSLRFLLWYAIACVISDNFVPCMSKFGVMSSHLCFCQLLVLPACHFLHSPSLHCVL